MCVLAENLSREVYLFVAPFELPLFILDEIGDSVLHAQKLNGAQNLKKPVVIDHDIGDDG